MSISREKKGNKLNQRHSFKHMHTIVAHNSHNYCFLVSYFFLWKWNKGHCQIHLFYNAVLIFFFFFFFTFCNTCMFSMFNADFEVYLTNWSSNMKNWFSANLITFLFYSLACLPGKNSCTKSDSFWQQIFCGSGTSSNPVKTGKH